MGPPPAILTPETYNGPEKTLPRRVFGVLGVGGLTRQAEDLVGYARAHWNMQPSPRRRL